MEIFASKPYSRKIFAGKSYSRNSRETLYPKLKNLRIWPFSSQLSLYMKQETRKTLRTQVFHTKTTWKTLKKHEWYKSLSKANKNKKNLFGLIYIWLSTHTSYLNMYKHTNEIDIHWTLNMCVMCHVCIKYGIVLSLEWNFNDQFNQVIHNWY